MSDNGKTSSTDEILDGILAPLREQLAELRAAKQIHVDAIAELDVEIKKLGRVERAADPDAPRSGPKASEKTKKKGISEEKLATMLRVIRENVVPDEPFTSEDVEGWATLSHATVGAGLRRLREDETIRLIGRIPQQPGKIGLTPYAYRLMD